MKVRDVSGTLDLALANSWLDQINVEHLALLLSNNGTYYISADLAEWLDD
jgi:putative transposase